MEKETNLLDDGCSTSVKEAGLAGLAAGAAFPFILILGIILWGALWHPATGEPSPGGSIWQNSLGSGYLAVGIFPWSTAIGGILAVLLAGLFHMASQHLGLARQPRVRYLPVICMAIFSASVTYLVTYALWGIIAVIRLPPVNLPSTLASVLAAGISIVWSVHYLRKTNL